MLVEKKSQEEEIVFRNEGDIDDLLNHIQQEIHLNSIIQLKLPDSVQKSILKVKLTQLYEIKLGLQQALDKWNKELE